MLSGDEAESQKLRERLTLCKGKIRSDRILGYPKDYLAPTYTCADCKDTGYIGNERCHCFKQAAIDLVYTQSNLKSVLEKENFPLFLFPIIPMSRPILLPDFPQETAQNAVAECRNFIAGFTKEFSNLFLYGDTGVGKTFLSNCVAKELLDRGHSVIYFTAFELFHVFEKKCF